MVKAAEEEDTVSKGIGLFRLFSTEGDYPGLRRPALKLLPDESEVNGLCVRLSGEHDHLVLSGEELEGQIQQSQAQLCNGKDQLHQTHSLLSLSLS